MKVHIISAKEVHELLTMKQCIHIMTETLRTLAQGNSVNPLRSVMRFPTGKGLLGLMPAYLEQPAITGMKLITVMPGNHGTPYDSHQGFVILFEVEHGCPVALVDAGSITAIRTAAVSAVATNILAREDAKKLAILGSGVQAGTHLEAMSAVRNIDTIRIWSRNEANARAFVVREAGKYDIDMKVVNSAQEAVAGADVICTTTAAQEPVLNGQWLSAGTHINAIGACVPNCRELDTEAVLKSRLYVDRMESAVNEAGDFLIPKREGALGDEHIVGELGDVLSGKLTGRNSGDEITLFKGLGIGVEDLAVARYVYEQAVQSGAGTCIDF